MDCNKFQDSITDYLDGALESRMRAECAAHRLICRECRELYNDVRMTVQTLNSVAHREIVDPEGLEHRIIAATTAGEMLSCGNFDKLIERYFDGVILAPTFQTFQAHFEQCSKCRRLIGGIEEVIAMCREIKESEVEVPESLHERIVAATVGARKGKSARWGARALACLKSFLKNQVFLLWTPQMAVAALIFAASSLLIISRFGSVGGMAAHAETQAGILVNQGQRAINQTGAMARTGFQRVSSEVNTFFFVPKPAPISVPESPAQIESASPRSIQPEPDSTPQSSPRKRSARSDKKHQREQPSRPESN